MKIKINNINYYINHYKMNRTIINNISKNISKNFVPIFHSAYSDNTMIINKNMIDFINIRKSLINKTYIVEINNVPKLFKFDTKEEAIDFVNDILKE